MKKTLHHHLTATIILFLIAASFVNAQEEKPGIGKGDLESQFNYMIYQSDKSENYRVVRSWWLYNIRNQVVDSLNLLQGQIDSLQLVIVSTRSTVDTLQSTIATLETKVDNVTEQRDNIVFVGLSMQKQAFKNIFWVVTAVLAVLLLVFIVMYKRSNSITTRSIADLEETKNEFEDYKKRALVREQQQMRKMYDEVLKYKNQVKSNN